MNMKLIAEISEGSLGIGEQEQIGKDYILRKSVRAILLNENGEMAIQYLENHSYHKLPGGGIDAGEKVEEALKREVLEEVGCNCDIQRPVGMVIEYRNAYNMIQISYCFVAEIIGEVGTPKLEEEELEEGHVTLWMKPEIALEKIESDKPHETSASFILEREKVFLREYLSF